MATANNRILALVFAVGAACFAGALYHLLMLRYETGDAYPPYSSFRADPLGTRALYEAWESVPGVTVSRNLAPITRLQDGKDTTLLICGATLSDDPKDVIDTIGRFAATGGRVVIAFAPVPREPSDFSEEEEEKQSEEEEDSSQKDEEDGEDAEKLKPDPVGFVPMVSIEDVWGFTYAFDELPRRENRSYAEVTARRSTGVEDLPDSLSWHSALYFDELDEAWNTLYISDGKPILIERPLGAGTLVLVSDSYLFSNEAMWEERHPRLLTWVAGTGRRVVSGAGRRIVFDERHFGIAEKPGVMALARRYRLHGLLASLAVVAALFVWRSLVSLTPKVEDPAAQGPETLGKGSRAGLSNLLRRSIPPSDLLAVCYDEWRHGPATGPRRTAKTDEALQDIVEGQQKLPARQRDLLRSYREICQMIQERKRVS